MSSYTSINRVNLKDTSKSYVQYRFDAFNTKDKV